MVKCKNLTRLKPHQQNSIPLVVFPLRVPKVFDDSDRWLCCKYKIEAIRMTSENEQTRVMS